MKKKNVLAQNGISKLAANINKELKNMELDLKGRMTVGYWRVGRWIALDILKNRDRAGYGVHLYEQLAQKTSASKRTLERTVQLYRTYPIASQMTQLPWTHFLHLMSVKDERRRKQLEHQAAVKGWDSQELKSKIKAAAAVENPDGKNKTKKEIPPLTLVRGQVNTFALVEEEEENDLPAGRQDLLVDLGFRLHRGFAQIKSLRLEKDDCVQIRNDRFSKTAAVPKGQLFTYKAEVKKIIDGDTLVARVHLNFRMFITQKFRLRGIDCPEIDTPEGKRAKRFVEERLKGLDFIVIKTHKDTTDKYDRYLADIFYLPRDSKRILRGSAGETGGSKVAAQGNFLNQDLLDHGHAVPMG